MKYFFSLLVSLFLCQLTLAANKQQYAVIIDAGSSGSRLHLYQYEMNESPLPIIKEILSAKTDTPLASFADHPTDAGASLQPALSEAEKKLRDLNVPEGDVAISVLSTAGMRLLPIDAQQQIYQNLTSFIQANTAFSIQQIETISGKMEGIYGWLDVNYLEGAFTAGDRQTKGIIDMGGASTEIAFATNDFQFPDDEITLQLGKQTYHVFSKSFLNLGTDQAQAAMNTTSTAPSCYPLNYSIANFSGRFDLNACRLAYQDVIQTHREQMTWPALKDETFIAYSGAYYTFHFFGSDESAKRETFDSQIASVCNQPWETLKNNNPKIPEKYLSGYCANGVYLDQLFFETYGLRDDQLRVMNSIQQTTIDWAMGALLYQTLNKPLP